MFVDVDAGARIGVTRLPRDQVPESFGVETTVDIGATTWLVVSADPAEAADVAAAGRLVLTVRRAGGLVPTADIRYSLPTICDVLPAAAGTAGSGCLLMHEDDWRQIEMVSLSLLDVAAAELRAIRAVYDNHAQRDASGRLTGFTAIHVRARPERPLPGPLSRQRLTSMLPAPDHEYGGVGFTGTAGVVAGSFAAAYGSVQLYGISDGDHLAVLGLRRLASGTAPPGLTTALRQVMDILAVAIIDWCRCAVIDAGSLPGYLAA